jgi:hypothetical protein
MLGLLGMTGRIRAQARTIQRAAMRRDVVILNRTANAKFNH